MDGSRMNQLKQYITILVMSVLNILPFSTAQEVMQEKVETCSCDSHELPDTGLYAIDLKVSDHNVLISTDSRVMSWNIWAPLTRNGLQSSEAVAQDREENKDPLSEVLVTQQIERKVEYLAQMLVKNPNIEIVSLQEVPGNFRDRRQTFLSMMEGEFRKHGLTHFIAKDYMQLEQTGGESFGQLTLFDARKYEAISSEDIESSRVLVTNLKEIQQNNTVSFWNIHLKSGVSPKPIIERAIQSKAVVAGDANFDAEELFEFYKKDLNIQSSAYSRSGYGGNIVMTKDKPKWSYVDVIFIPL